jgi:hypothetical protein
VCMRAVGERKEKEREGGEGGRGGYRMSMGYMILKSFFFFEWKD